MVKMLDGLPYMYYQMLYNKIGRFQKIEILFINIRKSLPSQTSKQKMSSIETIKYENAELRKIIEMQAKEIERCKNVVYQLVGGLYNENTQQGTSSRHVKQLFGYNNEQELQDEKDSWTIWPTTRQGDANEERIKKLEETIKNLEERFEKMEGKK